MAIAHSNNTDQAAATTSGNTLALTTSVDYASGDFMVLRVAADNIATADGDTNNHSSVTSSSGNWTITKLGEHTNTVGGSAADGITVSLWLLVATAAVSSGATVTVNFSTNLADRVCSAHKFTKASDRNVRQKSTTQTGRADGSTNPGSLAISISPTGSINRLYFRAVALESNTATNITTSTNFTAGNTRRSQSGASGVATLAEYRIVLASPVTSAPTLPASGDSASLFVCLEEYPFDITASSGSFALTGTDTALKTARLLTAAAGSFLLSGTATAFKRGLRMPADAAAFVLSGTDAALKTARLLSAGSGSFALTGTNTNFKIDRLLTPDPAAFALTGTSATLNYGRTFSVDPAAFALSGTNAALKVDRLLTASGGTFALTGTTTPLIYARIMTASPASFLLSGTAVLFRYSGDDIVASWTVRVVGPDVTGWQDMTVSAPVEDWTVRTIGAGFTWQDAAIVPPVATWTAAAISPPVDGWLDQAA